MYRTEYSLEGFMFGYLQFLSHVVVVITIIVVSSCRIVIIIIIIIIR